MASALPARGAIPETPRSQAARWLFICLWIVTASATLFERDVYRYTALILVAYGAYRYMALQPRPAVGWPAWLCIGWAIYALVRFVLQYLLQAGHPTGDAELLYVMPLAFPSLGFALFLCWDKLPQILAVYFGAALVTLLATTHYREILLGETARPLVQHNQIHGAVCCGVILIAAIFWIVRCRKSDTVSSGLRLYATIVAPLVWALCLFCIYGAKSKGVWLALGCSFPFLLFSVVSWFRSKTALVLIACLVLLMAGSVYFVRGNINATAGPTFVATSGLIHDILAGQPVGDTVAARIANPTTPSSMDERLQLWANAWELLSTAPILGLGNEWDSLWHQTHYTAVDYAAMHDGYFEILVRYGVSGLILLIFMAFVCLRQVQRAVRRGVISLPVFQSYLLIQIFFGLTLLSNSNNRLAIGETIIMLSFSFALACNLKIRQASGAPGFERLPA